MEIEKKQVPALNKLTGAETNPFVVELKGKMYLQPRANTIIARGQEIVDTNTGEIIRDDVLIGRRRVVDKSQFAKLYASEVGILFELSRPAVNVFLYLTKVMDYDNKAIFDYTREHKKLGYKSHKQCLIGIRELISKGIIYPHLVSGIWWLNPTIVCKGERFAVYTEYVTEEKAARDDRMRERMIKATSHSELAEQSREWYDDMNDATDGKLEAMSNEEERREKEKHAREIREMEEQTLFPELGRVNPYDHKDEL